jgi:TM2 domain-containing membrane protein YozV
MGTPAGWYPTPDGRQRYWDGEAWTEHSAPGVAGAPTSPAMHLPYQAVHPAYRYQVEPKNPGLALLASFFIPGLGSMIVGRAGIGAAILVGYLIAVVFSFILIGLPFVLGFWIWGMIDAYTGAQSWNARHGIIS